MTNSLTLIQKTDGTVKGMVATQAAAWRQDLKESEPFAPLRQNNHVETFTNGKSYFAAVHASMKAATRCIFIIGWQVNWDVELIPGERLIDVLHDRVQSSDDFRVYVLPWMSPKIGVDTGDFETTLAIFQLNAGRKSIQAMCCPAGAQNEFTGVEAGFFAHHQKLVVIDNKTAFIGGMDLAYGRRDDDHFALDFGTRRFNERYSPGVPPLHALKPEDGRCLSLMDLLAATLGAPFWKSGSNTDPSALAQFLSTALGAADRFAIEAVALTNRAAAAAASVASAGVDLYAQGARATAHGAASAAKAGADVAVAAGQAVSHQCAAMSIPDLYGGVERHKLGPEATSGISQGVEHAEESARTGLNTGVDTVAGLADFLAPLKRLRVDPQARSGLGEAAASGERLARSGVNAMIDGAAALGSGVQAGAAAARDVCVAIGPAVEHGVAATKAATREAAQHTAAKTAQMASRFEGTVNAYQQRIIGQINVVRQTINDEALSALGAAGQWASDNATGARVQAVIDQLKRLLKLVYVAQLALDWSQAERHPWLLVKTVKAAPKGMLVPDDTQTREPWQDVHCVITGPAVYDLAMNFVRRWDATHDSYLSDGTLGEAQALSRPIPKASPVARFESTSRKAVMIPAELIPTPPPKGPPAKPTGVAVRVLRSAPIKLQQQEAKALRTDAKCAAEQCEIQTQMINVITNATDFVYIENQFFQSEFGTPSVDSFGPDAERTMSSALRYVMSKKMNLIEAGVSTANHLPSERLLPANKICEALGRRIESAVRRGEPFHVYMVLPVHPEGRLDDPLVIGQVHWTMQSLVFADHSLINRIRRAIKAKEICTNTLNNGRWDEAMKAAGSTPLDTKNPVFSSVVPDQWGKYLTLLNVRNCQIIDGRARTEQIYVHSKLLIADDRHIILGSANINDRSQSGSRDSELAVMLFDSEKEVRTICDAVVNVNPLARELRVRLWKKHLAFDGANEVVKSAASTIGALIERPAAENTIKAIQRLARENSILYRQAFSFVPWSLDEAGASLWPVCSSSVTPSIAQQLSAKMPFHDGFWDLTQPRSRAPSGIRGFFTAFPVNWTKGENNHPAHFNAMALTLNDRADALSIRGGRIA